MMIAVMSDIHDNLWQLGRLLKEVALADALVFCGDFCAPFTLDELASRFAQPIYAVFGNNDGDKLLMTTVAARHPHVKLLGDVGEITLDDLNVAVAHSPVVGQALAAANTYDLVCSGHTHVPRTQQIGRTLWINPGEVMGRRGRSTAVVYDTNKKKTSLSELPALPIEW